MNILQKWATTETTSYSRVLKCALYLLIAMPAIVYLLYVLKYALDMPRQDDYDAVLAFLVDFNKAGTSEKVALLFSQHNEHRMLFSRLIFVAYYKITGVINFRNVIILNYGILLLLFLLFVSFARKLLPGFWHLAAFIASACLFSINSFENADFAMAGTQNFGVVMLFMASLFYYHKKDAKLLPIAALLQIICVFSSGNGNVAAFFLVVYALLSGYRQGMIVAILTFVIFSPLYYFHYTSLANGMFSSDPARFLPYFFHVIGAHFGREACFVLGFGILIALPVLIPLERRWKITHNALPHCCITAFVFSSVGVLSLFRAGLDIGTAYSSRYFIYSGILTAILSVFILVKVQGTKLQPYVTALLLLCIVFFYFSNVTEGKGGFEFISNNIKNNEYDYPDQVRAKKMAEDACKAGIYCIEQHRPAKTHP